MFSYRISHLLAKAESMPDRYTKYYFSGSERGQKGPQLNASGGLEENIHIKASRRAISSPFVPSRSFLSHPFQRLANEMPCNQIQSHQEGRIREASPRAANVEAKRPREIKKKKQLKVHGLRCGIGHQGTGQQKLGA